ncbi:MAG: ABC transporter substrate-binding protein [Candidatus Bathyarchaeia archaeon]
MVSRKAVSTSMALIAIIIVAAIAGGAGYYVGNSLGYSTGYQAGSSGGFQDGNRTGFQLGNQTGYLQGYQAGLSKGAPILPDVIKIGCLMDLSGGLGPMGVKIQLGAKLAVDEVNARGGIRGRPIQLIVEDTETKPAKALEAARKLVEVDGVQVIIGPLISGAARLVGPYVTEKRVLLITPSVSGPFLSYEFANGYVMRVCPSDELQAAAMSDLVLNGTHERIAFLIMNNPYGLGIEGEVKKRVGNGTITINYDETKLDYRAELESIKAANPDVVVHVGYYEDGKVVFRQALEAGLENVRWITAEGCYGTPMLEDPMCAEFMSLAVTGTTPKPITGIIYDDFKARHREAFGMDPEVYGDTSYDAAMLAILGIAYCGEYNGTKIRDAVLEISKNYIGPSGHKMFKPNGVDIMTASYIIWDIEEVSPGQYRITHVAEWSPPSPG